MHLCDEKICDGIAVGDPGKFTYKVFPRKSDLVALARTKGWLEQ